MFERRILPLYKVDDSLWIILKTKQTAGTEIENHIDSITPRNDVESSHL